MKIIKKITVFVFAAATLLCGACETSQAAKKNSAQYWPEGPQIVSASAIVIDADTGTALYEKNIHDAHYPASITKILTTLLAIENSNMDEVVTFSHDSVYNTEGSGIARDVGEQMTMKQCLYAVMLASANECAYAVAEHVAGDIGTFVQMMNERAAALGCKDTNFTNCNGLPDESHYTSAHDMALIAKEAYRNESFRIIASTKTYTIPFTNKHTDEETYLQNHHQMLYPLKTRKYLYEYCLGGKTGYTIAANNTLVTYAEKDGMTLICVVLNAPASGHYEDTRALFDFCFDNFKKMNIQENETSYSQQNQEEEGIVGGYEPFVSLNPESSVILPITAEFQDADSEIVCDETDEDVLGSIFYTYAGRQVGRADLVATDHSVDSYQFLDTLKEGDAKSGQTDVKNQDGSTNGGGNQEADLAGEEGNKSVEPFRIELWMICAAVAGVAILGLLIFLGYKLVDNFYYIKRKLHLNRKEKSPYKTIKENKFYRKRH